jgi:hypothetical protein
MGRRYQTIGILILALALAAGHAEDLVRPPATGSTETSSKEEKGILASLILIYTKSRNAVRSVYDEIQYWKNMVRTYKMMEAWFNRNKQKLNEIVTDAMLVSTRKEDIFSKLKRADEMFSSINDVAFNETQNFDHTLATFERNWDSLAVHSRPAVRMMPTTDDVLSTIQTLFPSEQYKESLGIPPVNSTAASQGPDTGLRLSERDSRLPEAGVANISEFVAASAIAKSEVYYGWSVNALGNVDQIGEKFKDFKSINQKEMEAAWYGIEQINANCFRLRLSSEELKVYLGILGFDLWRNSQRRGDEEYVEMINHDYEKQLMVLRDRERSEYYEKNGMKRKGDEMVFRN